MLSTTFNYYTCFGFSGSRKWGQSPAPLSSAAAAVPPGSRVLVGCAAGVDAFFRLAFPTAEVFSVASGQWGRGRGAFAARSVACVRAVVNGGGLWVSFPSSPCPVGLVPAVSQSRCFSGSGSGSWASLAFALGCSLPCVVFLGSLPVPVAWGLSPVPGLPGWFGCPQVLAPSQSPVQLPLF
ncbi:hypothetical protein [Nostoc sp.]|uniref:hypothetical protein n=1 Tax=Nostoc sp. TaxID=1180 RepID=UPI0035948AA2